MTEKKTTNTIRVSQDDLIEGAPAVRVNHGITIRAPRFEEAIFGIRGVPDVPLVVHRFSAKLKQQMLQKMETGKAATSKKVRDPKNSDQTFHEARYRARGEGWDGFHAASIRNACISACRLVGYKMTLMKLSLFTVGEGVDAEEPQIPLVRIRDAEPIRQEDVGKVETGQPYVTIRAAYFNWTARVRIRWDVDQFRCDDICNLLVRVGSQVGLCEGRPDSPKSAGMGWGLFTLDPDVKAVEPSFKLEWRQ